MVAIEFRCERCGKLLSAGPDQGLETVCPQCGARARVPEGLASLPLPLVAPNAEPAPAPAAPQPARAVPDAAPTVMLAMSRAMPWAFSVFLHLGVLLMMTFGVLVVIKTGETRSEEIAVSPEPGDEAAGPLHPGEGTSELPPTQAVIPTGTKGYTQHLSGIEGPVGHNLTQASLIGIGGERGGGTLAPFGPGELGGSDARTIIFITGRDSGDAVVYVVDRSGSMAGGLFDQVRDKMCESIGRLRETQLFHVILFSDGPPLENPPRRLVPATYEFKRQAAEFLTDRRVYAVGQTDPIPAINRAFDVLAAAPGKARVMCLLTDAAFKNNQAVLSAIRAGNRDKAIRINTLLYGYTGTADANDPVLSVMKRIASENGGSFRKIDRD